MYMFRSYNTFMNRRFFKKRSLSETLRLVCEAKGGRYLWSGKPNSSFLAEESGLQQGTVNRWLSGTSKPNTEKMRPLAKALGLSVSQLLGEEPIRYVDGEDVYLDEDDYFARSFPRLPEKAKKSILHQVEIHLADEDESDR